MSYSTRIAKKLYNITKDKGYSARITNNGVIVQEVHLN